MKIIVENEQERQLITSLCDVALRAGGVRNLKEVEIVLNSIKPAEKQKPDKGKKNEKAK